MIEPIGVADFEDRVDLQLLSRLEIYPSIWDQNEDEAVSFLRHGYVILRQAFQSARAAEEAMILALT